MKINAGRWDFILDAIKGDMGQSYEKKFETIPNRLFRFEKFDSERLNTVEQNMIYMSEAQNFNDPFDCLGVWWDTSILKDTSDKQNFNYSLEYLDNQMEEMFRVALAPLKATCFSSELYNLPLWGNYAESGSGFVVEYDFKKSGVDSDFTKQLYPVIYREEREDISEVLKQLFEASIKQEFRPVLRLLFYKNLIKHISWSYEREWRLLFLDNDNHVNLPIKPTAVYITDRCNEDNEIRLKLIAEKLHCNLIRLTPTQNNRDFIFSETLT